MKISGCSPINKYVGHCQFPGKCQYAKSCWDKEKEVACKFKMKGKCYSLDAIQKALEEEWLNKNEF